MAYYKGMNQSTKSLRVKPSAKQTRAARELVANGGNVSKAMIAAGYSPNTANTPQKLTESRGFQMLLDSTIPKDFILKALREDIAAKPGNRVQELSLGAKMQGMTVERSEAVSLSVIEVRFSD